LIVPDEKTKLRVARTTFIAFDRTRGSLPFDSAVTVHVVAVDALRFRPFIEQPAPETVKLTEVGE
jgi:hypothetical protein